jgi:hypothetical protein
LAAIFGGMPNACEIWMARGPTRRAISRIGEMETKEE